MILYIPAPLQQHPVTTLPEAISQANAIWPESRPPQPYTSIQQHPDAPVQYAFINASISKLLGLIRLLAQGPLWIDNTGISTTPRSITHPGIYTTER